MWLPDVVAGAGNGRFWGLGAVTCPLGGGYPSWREAEVTGEVTAVTLDPRISSVYFQVCHDSGDCDTVLGKRAKEDRRPCDECVVRVDDLRALGTFTTVFFLQGDMNF
jgi:hypothetical protein